MARIDKSKNKYRFISGERSKKKETEKDVIKAKLEPTRVALTGINIGNVRMSIRHQDLERVSESIYKSECPTCNQGMMLVGRNPGSMALQRNDHCILCGQMYFYTDLEYIGESVVDM